MIYRVEIKFGQKGANTYYKGSIDQTVQSENCANAVTEVLSILSEEEKQNLKKIKVTDFK